MLKSVVISLAQKEISTAGWVVLGLIVFFVFLINFGLWSAWKHRDSSSYHVIKRFGDAIQHPNRKEDEQLAELNRRVKHLQEGTAQSSDEAVQGRKKIDQG